MRSSVIGTAALAGLTCVATAQNIADVRLFVSDSSVAEGGTTTISVVLSDNISGNSVFAFDLNISSSNSGFEIVAGSLSPDGGIFGFSGVELSNGVSALGGSSDILGPDLDPSLDGVTVFTFQVRVLSLNNAPFTFTASDGPGPNNAVQWGAGGGIVIDPRDYDIINFGSVSFGIPAPSGLALLSLAGGVAARRRR